MSFISMDVPIIPWGEGNAKDFIKLVSAHESLLKHYGAIKIIPSAEFKQVLKKKQAKPILSPTVQTITTINKNDYIYSVDTVPCINEEEPQPSLPLNESAFWLSLSHSDNKQPKLGTSIVPKMSFFLKRVHRHVFDIHQLPCQSLLKLCSTTFLDKCLPSLIRAHGPGAIFPLASTHQRLLSFNYHHAGGYRQWYIIPACEREALERICQQETTSICPDHGHVLIDPLIFDKHKIRYHRLIQYPNEIVVLAPGALSQSFTEDESWHETIDFALPIWLKDGHARASRVSSCKCRVSDNSSPPLININLFRNELVERYISANLNNVIDDKDSPNPDETNSEIEEVPTLISTTSNSITSSDQPLNRVALSFVDDHFFENEDMDDYTHPTLLTTEHSSETASGCTHLTTPHQSEGSNKSIHDLYKFSPSQDLGQGIMTKSSSESHHLSLQEIMDLITTPPNTVQSTESQTEEKMDEHRAASNHRSMSSISTQTMDTPTHNTHKEKCMNATESTSKTLCISGMKNTVTKADIRQHFVDCTSIIIKQSQSPPHLNFAFVVHRTSQKAEYNRKRRIDPSIFGSDCHIEYASSDSQLFKKWNIVVRHIPENVTEKCLRDLFPDCHSMKYTPARPITKIRRRTSPTSRNKVLWGYAFLHYIDDKEVIDLMKTPGKYKINDQSLIISCYDETKSASAQREEMNYIRESSSYYLDSKIEKQ